MAVILAIGAAHLDRRGRSSGPFRLHASNVGVMREAIGGAAFNAAHAVCALGGTARLVSARGGDATAARVRDALATAGIEDLAVTWLDRTTPTYTALLDDNGDLVAGLMDAALYDRMQPRLLSRRHLREAFAEADVVLLDANLPSAAIERIVELAGTVPVTAIGVSPAKVARLAPVLPHLAGLFVSRAEGAQLTEVTSATRVGLVAELLAEAGCRRAVVTNGPRIAAILDGERIRWQEPPPVASLRDVTGAGDTLAGAATFAMVGGLSTGTSTDLVQAARFGMAAASLHICDARTGFTLADVQALAAEMPPPIDHPPPTGSDT